MNTFSVGECFRFAWETFKKRPGFFVGATVFVSVISGIIHRVFPFPSSTTPSSVLGLVLVAAIIGLLLQAFVKMGSINLLFKAHEDPASAHLSDLWYPAWNTLLYYVGASILSGVIIVIGFILLIIPGIYFSLRFMFVPYFVIDKKLTPLDALKESSRITLGHKGELLLLVLALIGINIVGAILLFIGLLVSIPVSMLAVVHAYRVLEHTASEVATV